MSREQRFVEYLQGLKDRQDRGSLAALRRGLGKAPGTVLSMAPFVEGWVGGLNDWDRGRFYLVASLFASYPGVRRTGSAIPQCAPGQRNFGGVFAGIVSAYIRNGTGPRDAQKRVERRFMALLNAHAEDLPRHLRHAVSLAKSENVPIDYVTLLKDLRYWDGDKRWVQQRWAGSFWAANGAEMPIQG